MSTKMRVFEGGWHIMPKGNAYGLKQGRMLTVRHFICVALMAMLLIPALSMGAITEPVITTIQVDVTS